MRRQKQLSLKQVETLTKLEFKASALSSYERGEREISLSRLIRLATIFEVPVRELVPEKINSKTKDRSIDPSGTPLADRTSIRILLPKLHRAKTEEAFLLRRVIEEIQIERQDFNGQVLTLRDDDIRLLAMATGESFEEFVAKLHGLNLISLE